MNNKKVGRPEVKEKRVSKTLGILPSKHKKIVKIYGSLTKFVEAMIIKENI